MGTVHVFTGRRHARAPSEARSAKTSNVIFDLPAPRAKRMIADHRLAGMPLTLQPLTVDVDSPRPSATAPVPPAASMIEPQVHRESVLMPDENVRNSRTCQALAECETTFRDLSGLISTMDSDLNIGRRIIAFREFKDMSQVDFADSINVARNTLNGYEKGTRPLTMESAKRIRDRWGLSIDWLLNGDMSQPGEKIISKLGPSPSIDADKKKPVTPKNRRKAS